MLKQIRMNKLTESQIQLICFLAFIIMGSIYTNFVIRSNVNDYDLIFNFFYNKINANEVMKTDLFEFILINRIKIFLVLWIIGFTLFSYYIDLILTAYYGFSFGLVFSTALMHNGFSSYFLVFLLLLPHYLIYVPIYIFLTRRNIQFTKSLYRNRKISKSFRINGQFMVEYFLILIICGLFLLIGIFLEAYINPELIKWYISIKNS